MAWRRSGPALDEAHAALVDVVVTLLRAASWNVAVEVTFNEYGDRGSIDVLSWHPPTRAVLVVEVKWVVADAQGTLSPLDRKVRLAPKLARDRGWSPTGVSRLLVIGEGPTNRRRVDRLRELFDAALPARNVAVRRWIAAPAGRIDGLAFFSIAQRGSAGRRTTGRERVRRPRSDRGLLK